MTIDMRKYGGEYYLTVPDVRDGPLPEKIVDVRDGKYDKPDLIFETGDALSLNATNRRVLMRAYGPTSDTWIDKNIECYLGEVEFQGKQQESVLTRPISPPTTATERAAAKSKPVGGGGGNGARDDDIPFAAEFR
jgi:hypothetical protein